MCPVPAGIRNPDHSARFLFRVSAGCWSSLRRSGTADIRAYQGQGQNGDFFLFVFFFEPMVAA